jgi:hypothetical protein
LRRTKPSLAQRAPLAAEALPERARRPARPGWREARRLLIDGLVPPGAPRPALPSIAPLAQLQEAHDHLDARLGRPAHDHLGLRARARAGVRTRARRQAAEGPALRFFSDEPRYG